MSFYDMDGLEANSSVFISDSSSKDISAQTTPYQLPNIQGVILGFVVFLSICLRLRNLINEEQKIVGLRSLKAFVDYYRSLYYFLRQKGSLEDCPYFKDSIQAQCHIYSLSLIFFLWDKPHYRSGTFQNDMLKNLRNVAVPGTGMPLSVFASSKLLAYWMILVGYPIISIISAVYASNRDFVEFCRTFRIQLVQPQDWFSFWRLNCRLATSHAYMTNNKWKNEYDVEDKWTFLIESEKKDINVTPFMKVEGVVCKHRNEEGGLGYQSFSNASVGGDWIIQERLNNGPFLKKLLPEDAPLSTFRIISSSRGGLSDEKEVDIDDITALSCVWRAGRSKALTDHSAIMFNVNPNTGEIKKGTTNSHWYQLGVDKIVSTPWLSEHNVTHHPDTGVPITGVVIPNMKEMMDFVRKAHLRLIPHVPLCGWDVAFTENHGVLLLEGNLSCNFFRGDFDQEKYFKFVKDYFITLDPNSKERKSHATYEKIVKLQKCF